jgi:hypothetical protein
MDPFFYALTGTPQFVTDNIPATSFPSIEMVPNTARSE